MRVEGRWRARWFCGRSDHVGLRLLEQSDGPSYRFPLCVPSCERDTHPNPKGMFIVTCGSHRAQERDFLEMQIILGRTRART